MGIKDGVFFFGGGGGGGQLFKGSTSEAALFVPSEGYRTTRLKECQSVALKWLAMNASLREKKKKKGNKRAAGKRKWEGVRGIVEEEEQWSEK